MRTRWLAIAFAGMAIAAIAALDPERSAQATPQAPARAPAVPAPPPGAKVDFETQVKPLLTARCQPCHFTGGTIYDRLPFDRPDTLRTLGEKKLFTRLEDEQERAVVRAFLAR